MYSPVFFESGALGERAYDVFSALLKNRIIYLGGPIIDETADAVVSTLLLLDESENTPIDIYINSPGGHVTAGLAIYDMMQYTRNTIRTFCIGQCASMAAILLAAGSPGERRALKHSRIMVHQPSGGAIGQATDIAIQADEVMKLKKTLNGILANHTGKDVDFIEKALERDYYMSADAAVEFGIIDEVMTSR